VHRECNEPSGVSLDDAAHSARRQRRAAAWLPEDDFVKYFAAGTAARQRHRASSMPVDRAGLVAHRRVTGVEHLVEQALHQPLVLHAA